MINTYQFGQITIDEKTYNDDVYIDLKGEVRKWWRVESHIFDKEDIEEAVKENPEIIVFGIGAYGMAELSKGAEEFIREKGIKIIISKTGEAVEQYNDLLSKNKKVIALLHLTC